LFIGGSRGKNLTLNLDVTINDIIYKIE
jgi:hypothetical protein